MNIVAKISVSAVTTDVARLDGRTVRVFGNIPCPHCLRGQLHANAVRELGDYQYAFTCQCCHRDVFTITVD